MTVGKFTYTSDQRFQVIHLDNTDDWSLQISYPQKKDAGIYECQVMTGRRGPPNWRWTNEDRDK